MPGGSGAVAASRLPCRHMIFPIRIWEGHPVRIYDLAANTGWVGVGTDHDTAAFAVACLRRWWDTMGRASYPRSRRLLITADAGGSNGYRTRAWKAETPATPGGWLRWNVVRATKHSHERKSFCVKGLVGGFARRLGPA